jgi:pantetheine-phosphate adenylyltransferase
MPNSIIAVYPGTFDPITLGHEDIVRRATRLFSKVIVAVAVAHHKKTLFNLQERIAMTQQALSDCSNVEVVSFDGLVSVFVKKCDATVMVRGIRSITDYDYESQLAGMNHQLAPDVETVFLNTRHIYQSISSTLVREISKLGGDVAQFVSPTVLQQLNAKNQQ